MPTRDGRMWMWAQACEMLTQADRLQQQFFHLGGAAGGKARWEPPVDIVEDDEQLYLCIALPGVAPERVSVSFEHGGIIVGAHRPNLLNSLPGRRRSAVIHRLEIPYGHFERRIALAPGQYELIEQAFHHGCLELRLAKR